MTYYCYMTINKINNKKYFGCHFWNGEGLDPSYLGSGVALRKAIKKYGRKNFHCYIVKEFNNEDDCRNYEEEILRMFDLEHDHNFYNMKNTSIGFGFGDMHIPCKGKENGFHGKQHTDEAKRRIGEASKLRQPPKVDKKVMCITTGEVFESITKASIFYGLDSSSISKCCRGKLKTTGGKQFKYTD